MGVVVERVRQAVELAALFVAGCRVPSDGSWVPRVVGCRQPRTGTIVNMMSTPGLGPLTGGYYARAGWLCGRNGPRGPSLVRRVPGRLCGHACGPGGCR